MRQTFHIFASSCEKFSLKSLSHETRLAFMQKSSLTDVKTSTLAAFSINDKKKLFLLPSTVKNCAKRGAELFSAEIGCGIAEARQVRACLSRQPLTISFDTKSSHRKKPFDDWHNERDETNQSQHEVSEEMMSLPVDVKLVGSSRLSCLPYIKYHQLRAKMTTWNTHRQA